MPYLTAEQYPARYESSKAELLAKNPFLADHGQHGSKLQEQIVRGRVIRELGTEVTDLVPFDSSLRAKYPWYEKPAA